MRVGVRRCGVVEVWGGERGERVGSDKTGSRSETNDDGGPDRSERFCSWRRKGVLLRWQHVGIT